MTSRCSCYSKEVLSLKHTFVESWHKQMDFLKNSENELLMLIRQEKVINPSVKRSDAINPQSDRLCTNERNSGVPLALPAVVYQ